MMPDRKEESMSHVDEGTLHAYLDGELPSGDRATLEAHVAQCATCRTALADERALRDRASAVLGRARPLERPTPPFEQIRRTPARRPWHVRMPFAWAASIVLALGVGYLLRGPGRESAADKQQPIAAEPIAQPIVIAENRSARAPAPSREKATTRRPPPAPAPADEIGRASEQSKTRADLAASTVAVTESARERTPDSLARDQSPVFRLDGVVVGEQARDSATVIQIFQRPASAAGAKAVRSDRLARFIGGLRVEIAGPVSLDSLNRLLNQVQPLPQEAPRRHAISSATTLTAISSGVTAPIARPTGTRTRRRLFAGTPAAVRPFVTTIFLRRLPSKPT